MFLYTIQYIEFTKISYITIIVLRSRMSLKITLTFVQWFLENCILNIDLVWEKMKKADHLMLVTVNAPEFSLKSFNPKVISK